MGGTLTVSPETYRAALARGITDPEELLRLEAQRNPRGFAAQALEVAAGSDPALAVVRPPASDPLPLPRCEEVTLERYLLGKVLCELSKLRDRGQVRRFHHRPDKAPRGHEAAGMLDVTIGVCPGLVIAIELKTTRGRVTPEQVDWLECWGERGRVCRSWEEVAAFLRRFDVEA